jgi:hypothetical protein
VTSLCFLMMFSSLKRAGREKMIKSIEANYRRHLFYHETMELIEPLLLSEQQNIAEYNIKIVTSIAERLHIRTDKICRSSTLVHEGSSNELLCSITALVGGSQYMCGGGADGYQEEHIFTEHGIALKHQNFIHPTYQQRNHEQFMGGLSVIDAAMNLGWDGVKTLLDFLEC